MERSALINKVKTRIDEVSASGDVIIEVGVENTKPYDSIIDELLDESALEVLLKAPFYRLNISSGNVTATASSSNKKSVLMTIGGTTDVTNKADNQTGTIVLPVDFLRIVSLRLSDWEQPVTELALPSDEIAQLQSNKHLRGSAAKPVGILKKTAQGYVINYYSSSTHSVEEFLYIKKDTAENIADTQLIDAMVWICAAKTLGVLNESTLSNLCYENAKGLMV